MSKILSYVSKINKNQKEMQNLFKELMKNSKFSFNEEKTNIIFNDYFFNGIQTPKNIEFKDIENNNLKIFWEIDDINLINIDKNNIKFRVDIRKEKKIKMKNLLKFMREKIQIV